MVIQLTDLFSSLEKSSCFGTLFGCLGEVLGWIFGGFGGMKIICSLLIVGVSSCDRLLKLVSWSGCGMILGVWMGIDNDGSSWRVVTGFWKVFSKDVF